MKTRSLEGKNALHQAVEASQEGAVRLLLELGADPEVWGGWVGRVRMLFYFFVLFFCFVFLFG